MPLDGRLVSSLSNILEVAEKGVWSHWTTVSASSGTGVPRRSNPRRLGVAKPKAHDPCPRRSGGVWRMRVR